jgi:GNAT superfamily N-acetyltransferase
VNLPVVISKATKEDLGFVIKTWVDNYKSSDFGRYTPGKIYWDKHKRLVRSWLPYCETIVARNQDDESQLFGFACFYRVDSVVTLHYILVKKTYQGLGIGRQIYNAINPEPVFHTHYKGDYFKLKPKSLLDQYQFMEGPHSWASKG